MKYRIGVIALAALLALPAQAQAAGCISGAIVGGLAAHATHHSTLLGALGGCVVGRVLAHPGSSITYKDVTGKLLGSDADLPKVEKASKVNIVELSSLKGYRANDRATQQAIAESPKVKHLDDEVASSPNLSATLDASGFGPPDVLAVSASLLGTPAVYVNR